MKKNLMKLLGLGLLSLSLVACGGAKSAETEAAKEQESSASKESSKAKEDSKKKEETIVSTEESSVMATIETKAKE